VPTSRCANFHDPQLWWGLLHVCPSSMQARGVENLVRVHVITFATVYLRARDDADAELAPL